jgi:glyoxylase-like metal-dependent hydrolase (beta-lactamase superfamily II)
LDVQKDDIRVHKANPELDPDGILGQLHDRIAIENIKDGDTFAVLEGDEDFEVTALHCPGHAKDHMAFVVTKSSDENEVGCMFTADNVLGHGTAVFENLSEYLKSLELMKSRIGEGRRAFPGHGEVIDDGRGRIQFYLEHRRMREEEALNVLRFGAAKRPEKEGQVVVGKEWGSMEMVKVIYADVPENLHVPAEGGLLMVLEKLRGEGRVARTEGGKWKIGERGML